jgi:hypothetical protein
MPPKKAKTTPKPGDWQPGQKVMLKDIDGNIRKEIASYFSNKQTPVYKSLNDNLEHHENKFNQFKYGRWTDPVYKHFDFDQTEAKFSELRVGTDEAFRELSDYKSIKTIYQWLWDDTPRNPTYNEVPLFY